MSELEQFLDLNNQIMLQLLLLRSEHNNAGINACSENKVKINEKIMHSRILRALGYMWKKQSIHETEI